jgi:hypothetical protein
VFRHAAARLTLRPMDLTPRVNRLATAVASRFVQLWRRTTWPARLAILAFGLFLVALILPSGWVAVRGWVAVVALLIGIAAFLWGLGIWKRATWQARLAILASCVAIVAWLPPIGELAGGWVTVVCSFIGIAAVLLWLVSVLIRWLHVSWTVRLAAIGGLVFVIFILVIPSIQFVLHLKPISTRFVGIVGWIIIYLFILAGLAFLAQVLEKVIASPIARVLVWLGIAFLYFFPPILVFLATNGNVNTFRFIAMLFPNKNQHFNWTNIIGTVFLLAVPLLLIITPEILRRNFATIDMSALPEDMKSKELKDMVTKGLAVGAALASGLYILPLHFYGGPLAHTSIKQLLFAIIALAILLSPFYKSVASVCLERGIAAAFDPAYLLKRPWAVFKETGRIFLMQARNQEIDSNSGNLPISDQANGDRPPETEETPTGQ